MTTDKELVQALDQALDERSLSWAAKWIEDSLQGETNDRVIEFGRNMAMTLRAAASDSASAAPVVDMDLFSEMNARLTADALAYHNAVHVAPDNAKKFNDCTERSCVERRHLLDRASASGVSISLAAATAAPQVSNDLLRDAGAIIIVNEGSAGARVEIRFAELQDAQRLHQALAQMRVAAPVDHNSIPLTTYERILTIEWDKYNARRHELIKAERSRVLSESEVLELFELQWLARIKHGVLSGPRVTQKQPLPDHFLCINPEEQSIVINFLRGYGTDAERELARLHLNLCLRCQELANAAPVEQSDPSIPTCPDCQQGCICEHCGKSIIDYYSGNEGAR